VYYGFEGFEGWDFVLDPKFMLIGVQQLELLNEQKHIKKVILNI
jgi:hypothetical protein